MGWLLVLMLVALVVAVYPRWTYSRGWGFWPSGLLSTLLLVVLLLTLFGAF